MGYVMGRFIIFLLLLVTMWCAKLNCINGIPLDSLQPPTEESVWNVTDQRRFIDESSIYCELETFKTRYRRIHGPLALTIGIFGILSNIASIFTLTQMDPTISQTNAILAILNFSNILVNLSYIPYALHSYIFKDRPLNEADTYLWAHFVSHLVSVSQMFHTISTWLTLLLAASWYASLTHPFRSSERRCTTLKCTYRSILLVCLIAPVFFIPVYPIHPIIIGFKRNGTDDDTVESNNILLQKVSLLTFSIVNKIIPCLIFSIFSILLFREMKSTIRGLENIMTPKNSDGLNTSPDQMLANNQQAIEHQRVIQKNSTTTRMLLIILLLFILTELPQGILGLLSGILGNSFFYTCYDQLGDLMDIFPLINSSIIFILFSTMSRQFLSTFRQNCCFQSLLIFRRAPTQSRNDNAQFVPIIGVVEYVSHAVSSGGASMQTSNELVATSTV